MRVAIVIERIETWRGGAETSTLEFAHLLAGRGTSVTVFTATRCVSPPDLEIVMIPVTATPKPLRPARFIAKTTARLRRDPFDIVHAITPMPAADVYQPRGGLVRETLERNVAMRATAPRRMVKRALAALNVKRRTLLGLEERALRPGGPVVAAVSKYVARQARAHYGLDGARVRVIFNGVQVAAATEAERAADRAAVRREYAVANGTLLILCVAHNFRLKGVEPLLHGMARLTRAGGRDVRLLVAGRDNPVAMAATARRLRIDDLVTFTGPTERIGAFYHAADVVAHATYYDPCSRVVLEALSRGVACVTTRLNGAAEAITDGVEGFVIETPDDVGELADRIGRLRDRRMAAEMGAAAARLGPRLSMTRHVDEMVELYDEIVARRAKREELSVNS